MVSSYIPDRPLKLSLSPHLKCLEAESIHIVHEVMAKAQHPVLLCSIDKDTSVLIHLIRKALYPAHPPVPLLHIDTGLKFEEIKKFREHMSQSVNMQLLVHTSSKTVGKDTNFQKQDLKEYLDIAITKGLYEALNTYKFDIVFNNTRRAKNKFQATKQIFSFYTPGHAFDPDNQKPELWNCYNTRKNPGEIIYVSPLANWTEMDIWQYIYHEQISIAPLYFAKKRSVIVRDHALLLVDDDHWQLLPEEQVQTRQIRFPTLDYFPLKAATSQAQTLEDIFLEISGAQPSQKLDSIACNKIYQKTALQLQDQSSAGTLRVVICGNSDDGKSTLIDHLLMRGSHELNELLEYKIFGHKNEKGPTQKENLSPHIQDVTIEVAYHFFSTTKRKFIIADSPGHEKFTRNMVTGASTADLAVILVNAKTGLQTQTRRHAHLLSLMGISHLVLAINKMDIVRFDEQTFKAIDAQFRHLAEPMGFASITSIPLSALNGDNIFTPSNRSHWYNGSTLITYLEAVEINKRDSQHLIFPLQRVYCSDMNCQYYAGTVISGNVHVGDKVRVTASGQTACIKEIIAFDKKLEQAKQGEAVNLVLDRDVHATPDDIFTTAHQPLEMTDQFAATLIWLHPKNGLTGRNYQIKLANQWTKASITKIKHCLNIHNDALEPCKKLKLNDISQCNLSLGRPLVFTPYEKNKTLGSFILVDPFSQATMAAGLIHYNLRRAQNVHPQALCISRTEREHLNQHQGKIIWFTGLSGSGKSTIANALEKELHAQGKRTYILDGDNIRQGLNKDLGFTDADRVENIRRVAEVAKLMMDAGLIVITAFISPFRAERKMARELIGEKYFVEVFVDTPLEVCEQRDPKGLYKKARRGELPNMTGIGSPYEKPLNADIVIHPNCINTDKAVQLLIHKIYM